MIIAHYHAERSAGMTRSEALHYARVMEGYDDSGYTPDKGLTLCDKAIIDVVIGSRMSQSLRQCIGPTAIDLAILERQAENLTRAQTVVWVNSLNL